MMPTDTCAGRILVFTEKHGVRYFDAHSPNTIRDVMLRMLQDRVDYGYIDEPEALEEQYGYKPQDDLTDEQIADLPTFALQQTAIDRRRKHRETVQKHERAVRTWELTKRALDIQDGTLAWEVLEQRADSEYEGFSFEYLENVT